MFIDATFTDSKNNIEYSSNIVANVDDVNYKDIRVRGR